MDRTITVRDIKVTVRELTVADVRTWIKDLAEGVEMDLVGDGLWQAENGTLRDVLLMTDLDVGEVEQLTPAEISSILDKCKKINPHFFGLRARLVREGEAIIVPSNTKPDSP